LADSQRNEILQKHTDIDTYLATVKSTIDQKKPHEDPGFSIDEIHHKIDDFKRTISKIFTSPAPKSEANVNAQE